MADDKFDILGPILAKVGAELANIVANDPDGIFLYAEAGEGWVSAGVFQELADEVRYFRPSHDLTDLLFEHWDAEDPDKRWAVMEYVIVGTRFDATFLFPDQIDPKEGEMERRPRALERRFGDKPVIYPPIPDHLLESK